MAESSERVSAAPEIVYDDGTVLVCVKPAGVLSTDEPGGLPGLLRERLGDEKTDLRTVHRLDRAVGGLMVLARGGASASALSRQIREGSFEKEYLAVVHGETADCDTLRDLMFRDKARKMSFVTDRPAKGVQEAVLRYETLWRREGLSCVRIALETAVGDEIIASRNGIDSDLVPGAEVTFSFGAQRAVTVEAEERADKKQQDNSLHG